VTTKLSQEEADILAAFEAGRLHSIATPADLDDALHSARLTQGLKTSTLPDSRHLKKA
jgi:hypothetical protein